MNARTEVIIALCKILWELTIWRLKLLKPMLTELSLGIIPLLVFIMRVLLSKERRKKRKKRNVYSLWWQVHPGDSWLSECTRGRNGLKLFYIRSLTAVGKKKNINRERSPRIKGCKDCNTLFFSNNRRPHFQYTERNYSFQAFNSVLPSNCHPRAKRYTTLTGGDSAPQTPSTSARARSEDAQERQANEPGEL